MRFDWQKSESLIETRFANEGLINISRFLNLRELSTLDSFTLLVALH